MGSSSTTSSSNKDLEDDDRGNLQYSNDADHQKGISRERTFQSNDCWTTLNCKLEEIARMLSQDMIRKKVLAHTVTMKVKLHDYHVYSRSKSLKRGVYIQTHPELIAVVSSLMAQIRSEHFATLKEGKPSFSCRLLGIRCSNLLEEEEFSSSQKDTIEKFLSTTLVPPPTTTVPPSSGARVGSKIDDVVGYYSTMKVVQEAIESSNTTTRVSSNDADTRVSNATSDSHVECPLCQRKFLVSENSALNQHIDSCLSGSTVRQVVRESTELASRDQPRKRQRLTDWWVQ